MSAVDDFIVKVVDGVPTIFRKSTGLPFFAPEAPAGAWLANLPSLVPCCSSSHPLPSHLPSPPASREKTRLTAESGARVEGAEASAHIGGAFVPTENPAFLAARGDVFDELLAAQRERLARKPRTAIRVTLPDGKVVEGVAWETTPLAIATGISKGLAASVVVAKVAYSSRVGLEEADGVGALISDGMEEELPEGAPPAAATAKAELWDLTRPLEGDCTLELKKFEDKDGKMVFWHSSAHVLGECMECKYGAKLCIGPPTEEGFYYDAYMGER
jgi:threonyl-tRNA synthetase